MTSWTEAFNVPNLISRKFYSAPGTQTIAAPALAGIIRISLVGAGGWDTNTYGGGAAFARKKSTATPAETFSLQIGDPLHSIGAGDALGDSKVTRVTGSVLLAKAERGKAPTRGLAANSVGDVVRDGVDGVYAVGGAPGGDSGDANPLGFGGRGVFWHAYPQLQPSHGGGGCKAEAIIYTSGMIQDECPGAGRICIEFFKIDPGY
jgi:hypothetical protein